MWGRVLIAASVVAACVATAAAADTRISAGPIVFASDRSDNLDESHQFRTSVVDGGTSRSSQPAGTPAPNGRATALVTNGAVGSLVEVRAIPSGETHSVATFAATDTLIDLEPLRLEAEADEHEAPGCRRSRSPLSEPCRDHAEADRARRQDPAVRDEPRSADSRSRYGSALCGRG